MEPYLYEFVADESSFGLYTRKTKETNVDNVFKISIFEHIFKKKRFTRFFRGFWSVFGGFFVETASRYFHCKL
jgi:hypothetical protein